MAINEEIAKLFATVGFKTDTRQLNEFRKRLDEFEKRMMGIQKKSVQHAKEMTKGLAATQLAQKRDLDIAMKKARLQGVELRNQQQILRLTERKARAEEKAARRQQRQVKKGFLGVDVGLMNYKFAYDRMKNKYLEKEIGAQSAWAFGPTRKDQIRLMREHTRQLKEQAREKQRAFREEIRHLRVLESARRKAFRYGMDVNSVGGAFSILPGAEGGGGAFVNGRGRGRPRSFAGFALGIGRGILPGLGAGWSAVQLNRINQEVIANEMAALAVIGSKEGGAATLANLRNMGNTIGFDYRQQTMPFLRMLSSGMNAGLSESTVTDIFQGTVEYGRVMGLDTESMKGTMRA